MDNAVLTIQSEERVYVSRFLVRRQVLNILSALHVIPSSFLSARLFLSLKLGTVSVFTMGTSAEMEIHEKHLLKRCAEIRVTFISIAIEK